MVIDPEKKEGMKPAAISLCMNKIAEKRYILDLTSI